VLIKKKESGGEKEPSLPLFNLLKRLVITC